MLRIITMIVLCCVGAAHAQPAAAPAAAPAAGQGAAPAVNKMPMADIEAMVGAIALYPDNLLANVLAGSVYPLEIVKAQRIIAGGGKEEDLTKESVEAPVKALAKVPDVLKMMSDNIDWTEALGQAYLAQAQDVMTAVQNLRAKAKANGALQSGKEQTVVQEGSTIIIEPAQPDVIYVPSYSPQVVYAEHPSSTDAAAAGIIGFGVGLAVGAIINEVNCDWHGGGVCWGHGDVDIDINNEINIDNSRVNNINKNELKNTNAGRARAGQQGQAWKPNATKASASNLSKPGGTAKMDKYRGASSGALPDGVKLPNPKRDTPVGTGGASANRAPSAGNTAARPSAPSRSSAPAKPAPAPSRPAPKAPAAAGNAGGFSTDRSAPAQSSRGAASRGSAGGARGGGGRR